MRSLDEAIEWVKRCPCPHPGESEIEIRQVFEAEDFGAELTPELREQEKRLLAEMSSEKIIVKIMFGAVDFSPSRSTYP